MGHRGLYMDAYSTFQVLAQGKAMFVRDFNIAMPDPRPSKGDWR